MLRTQDIFTTPSVLLFSRRILFKRAGSDDTFEWEVTELREEATGLVAYALTGLGHERDGLVVTYGFLTEEQAIRTAVFLITNTLDGEAIAIDVERFDHKIVERN